MIMIENTAVELYSSLMKTQKKKNHYNGKEMQCSVADPGGGALRRAPTPPPHFDGVLCFIPSCIRILQNKTQIAWESI